MSDVVDRFAMPVEKANSTEEVLTPKHGGLNGRDDDGSFGMGDTVIHLKMIRQGGSKKVGHIKGGVMHTKKLLEEEVKCHRLVGDRGVNAGWGDEGLDDRDSKRAVTDTDGSVLGGGCEQVRWVAGGGGHRGVGSLMRECHDVPAETVVYSINSKNCQTYDNKRCVGANK
jgi:hypothetical protein